MVRENTLELPGLPLAPTDAPLTPGSLMAAVKRRPWLAGGLGVSLAVVTAVTVWLVLPPPKPRVSTTLLLISERRGTLFEHPDPPLQRQTQVAIIQSKRVLTAALRNPEIATLKLVRSQSDPEDWLSKNVVVDFPSGPDILRITLSDPNTEDAIKVVNAVRAAYLDEVANQSSSDRRSRLDRLGGLAKKAEDNLKRKYELIEKLGKEVGTTVPENAAVQQRLIQEQIGVAQRELAKTRADLRRFKIEAAALTVAMNAQSGSSRPIPETDMAAYEDADPAVIRATQNRMVLEQKIRDIEKTAKDPNAIPSYLDAKAAYAATTGEIAEARKKARIEFQVRTTARSQAEVKDKLVGVQQQIGFLTDFDKVLAEDISVLEKESAKLNTANLHLESQRIEVRMAEELYSKVTGAINNLTAEQDVPTRVKPLDESASVERVDLLARKAQFATGGAVAAFLVGGMLVGLVEYRSRRVDSPHAVSKACGVTILGTVPRFPSVSGRLLGADDLQWQAARTESVDGTRTLLLHGQGLAGVRSLLVTSAESGEGKSSYAAQLAVSFARAGSRTLLIDGDMRKPGVAALVGIPPDLPGLAEVLRGEATASEVIRPSGAPGLDVLPAGRCDPGALIALARDTGTVRILQSVYDMIVIDSPPVLPVTDPLHFARQVDGVIIATFKDRSRGPFVREAVERVRRIGGRIIGAVVNGTTDYTHGYGYRYAAAYREEMVALRAATPGDGANPAE